MPKFPPPPRSPQNSSGCSVALAVMISPLAVTTSTESRLSQAVPCLRASQPMPPPSVSPAMPVVATNPPVVASPNSCVSRSNSPQVTPGRARAVPASGSTRTPFIPDRSMTMPSSQTAFPATLWPPPRTATRRPCSLAKVTAATTSATPAQLAMITGRLSTIPFQTRRAPS